MGYLVKIFNNYDNGISKVSIEPIPNYFIWDDKHILLPVVVDAETYEPYIIDESSVLLKILKFSVFLDEVGNISIKVLRGKVSIESSMPLYASENFFFDDITISIGIYKHQDRYLFTFIFKKLLESDTSKIKEIEIFINGNLFIFESFLRGELFDYLRDRIEKFKEIWKFLAKWFSAIEESL